MASRSAHYVNVTYDFDTFASLSLPTTVAVRLQPCPSCHACCSWNADNAAHGAWPAAECPPSALHGQDWQVLSPQMLRNLQYAGVIVDAVEIVAGET